MREWFNKIALAAVNLLLIVGVVMLAWLLWTLPAAMRERRDRYEQAMVECLKEHPRYRCEAEIEVLR